MSEAAEGSNGDVRKSLVGRALGAARLHADTFEEVEADRSSILQAGLLVAACCVAAGAGAAIRYAAGDLLPGRVLPLPLHIAVFALEPLVLWLVAGAFAYMVGATFLRGPETETDYPEVLRTTGFAFGPGALLVLAAAIPNALLALSLTIAIRMWITVAWIVAVRQALDFTTLRAVGTFLVSMALAWLVMWGLAVVPLP